MLKIKFYLMIMLLCVFVAGCDKTADVTDIERSTVFNPIVIEFPDGLEPMPGESPYIRDGRIYFTCLGDHIDPVGYSVDENGENGSYEEGASETYYEDGVRCASATLGKATFDVQYHNSWNDLSLLSFDKNGVLRFECDIESVFEIRLEDQPVSYAGDRNFEITAFVSDGERLYLASRDMIAVIDAEGEVLGKVKVNGLITGITVTGDGRVLVSCTSGDGTVSVRPFDTEAMKLGDKLPKPEGFENAGILIGEGYDMYLHTAEGMYGYTEGVEAELVIDWLASDINIREVRNIVVISPTKICVVGLNYISSDAWAAILTMTPKSEIVEKEIITVAYTTSESGLMNAIVDFNRQSDKYRVKTIDYGKFNTSNDYSQGQTMLWADVAAGRVPDIIIMNNIGETYPIQSLIEKGMFADLYSIDADGFFDNLLDCTRYPYESDGKLYYVPMSYTITSCFGQHDRFPDVSAWTVDTAIERLKTLDAEQYLLNPTGAGNIVKHLFSAGAGDFVDYKNAVCHFNSQSFIDILKYVKTLENVYLEDETNEMYAEGKILLFQRQISSMMEIIKLKNKFGADVSSVGYPTTGGGKPMITMETAYGITMQGNTEGAMEFLRHRLSDVYQDFRVSGFKLPITKSALDVMLDRECGLYYYFNDDGTILSSDKPTAKDIPGMRENEGIQPTESDREFFLGILSAADLLSDREAQVRSLLYEEFYLYLADPDCTAAECADKIQSRVSVYISETD